MGTAALIAITAILAYLLGVAVTASPQPYCPTEDSCSVDYRDGRWHIREETP